MASYSFLTVWRVLAPVERVWEMLADERGWPVWWPAIAAVRPIAPGDARRIGEVNEFIFRTPPGYRVAIQMTVTRSERPHVLDARSSGDLIGAGSFRLAQEGAMLKVRYRWQVSTTRWWMNLLAPVARPLVRWNHDRVMASGGASLARYLAQQPAASAPPAR